MKFSRVDARLVYANEWREALDLTQPVPRGWVAVDPPAGEGYWQWAGNRWLHLDEYPAPPEPPTPPAKTYDPDRLVLAVDALGKADGLEAALASAPARVRLRWQKATQFVADDPDFSGMISSLAAAWGLSPSQVEALLASCESGTAAAGAADQT